MFQVYVRKESRTSQQHLSLSDDIHTQLENCNNATGFLIAQSSNFSNMTHYQNILIDRYDFDLNKTINGSDWYCLLILTTIC